MSQYQFVMRSGPTPGVIFPLDGDQIHVGRDASNGVAINDAEISRKHSRLSFQGGKYVLEDLGSTNGTFVNGQRLAGPVVLKPGDVVSLGEHIVLMYDAINMDPGATVAVPRKPTRMEPPPVQAQVPAPVVSISTPLESSTPPSIPLKKTNLTPIIIGIVVFLFVCMCISFFFWIDATFRWCVFPISIIAEMLRGAGACQ